jgi:hypothetical protein
VFSPIDEVVVKVLGVFLEKEDVALEFGEVIDHLLHFPLLIEEAEFVERAESFYVDFRVFGECFI